MNAGWIIAVFMRFVFCRCLRIAESNDGKGGNALRSAQSTAYQDFASPIRRNAKPNSAEIEVYCFDEDVLHSSTEIRVVKAGKRMCSSREQTTIARAAPLAQPA